MKTSLLLLTAFAALMLPPRAEAATITVSPGFNNSITVPGFTTFTVAVGAWDGANFVQFGSSVIDSGSVNGSFTATVPPEVNNQVIHVFVGIGAVQVTSNNYWIVLRTSQNTPFPSDVSQTLASSTFAMNNSTPGTVVVAAAGPGASLVGNQIIFIPEPSSALLGLVGIAGLLRRRR
jgi:hypothetical protein